MNQSSNNEALRALFLLPPINESTGTSLATPEMPAPTVITGDREVDAVLWLQALVATGNEAYIQKAREAVKRIETPMKDLADRYAMHLKSSGAHPLQIVFSASGFGDLETKATHAIAKARTLHEALSRFGTIDALFADTGAEKACIKALRGVKKGRYGSYDDLDLVHSRFDARHDLTPHTIDDCLYVRAYWRNLSRLRNATGDAGDGHQQAYAHDSYCVEMMSKLTPRDGSEAIAAFDHLHEDGATDDQAREVARNLIVTGWEQSGYGDMMCEEELLSAERDIDDAERYRWLQAITDEQLDQIAESMPGGMDGFMKGWGWRQFARAVLSAAPVGTAEE